MKKTMKSGILIKTARIALLYLMTVILLVSIATAPTLAFASAQNDTGTESQEPNSNTDQETGTEETDDEADDQSHFNSLAEAAFLMEASTGKVLYEKKADQALPPASITKVMTLLLGFEALERGDISWDDMVTVSERAWREEGSEMLLLVDTQVRLEDIITGISVVSANDGCIALAEHLSGSVEAFVQLMNKRAKELGLTNTQFQNPNGLPAEGHYMSARDIAALARYLIVNHPKILEIESIKEFTYGGVLQYNRNPLLGTYPGADGLKTGWTEEAGYCLVGTAKRDEMRLISVVLRTKDEAERLAASRELLDYGFMNYELTEVVKKGDTLGSTDVKNGKELTVPVKADESITIVVQKDKKEDIRISLSLDEETVPAPVKAGTEVGKAEIRLDDELLASTKVSTAGEVEKAGFFEIIWRNIVDFFKSLFKVSRKS